MSQEDTHSRQYTWRDCDQPDVRESVEGVFAGTAQNLDKLMDKQSFEQVADGMKALFEAMMEWENAQNGRNDSGAREDSSESRLVRELIDAFHSKLKSNDWDLLMNTLNCNMKRDIQRIVQQLQQMDQTDMMLVQ